MPTPRRSATSTRKRSRSSAQRPRPRKRRSDEPAQCPHVIADLGGARRRVRRRVAPGPSRVDDRAGQGCARQARPAAADQAVRSVRLQRVRPAGPVQAAQDRADQGRVQARARPHATQGAARGVPARVARDGRHAREEQDRVCAGAHARPRRLPDPRGQLRRPELRRGDHDRGERNQAEGADPGRRRRLDRAVQHLDAAAGRSRHHRGRDDERAFRHANYPERIRATKLGGCAGRLRRVATRGRRHRAGTATASTT